MVRDGTLGTRRWLLAVAAGAVAPAVAAALRGAVAPPVGWDPTERAAALGVEWLCVAVVGVVAAWMAARVRPWAAAAVGAVLAAVVGLPGGGPVGPVDGAGRTVVLLTVDTLRRDHVGAWPDALVRGLTPNLDRIVGEGTRFDHAVAPATTTVPSHAAMLTGRAPWETGVVRNGVRVPEGPAVARALAEAGFRTAAFTSADVLGPEVGLDRGFATYRASRGALPAARALRVSGALSRAAARLWGASGPGKIPGERTAARAADWIRHQPREASLFLWVHLYDPHPPYAERPDAPWASELPSPCAWSAHPSALRRAGARMMRPYEPPLPARAECEAADWSEVRALARRYAAEVAAADRAVGTVIRALEDAGRWDEAAVVFAADHGENLVEHQAFGAHQYWLTEAVIHVPLAVRDPGCADCGAVRRDRVDLTQVAATLARAAGVAFATEAGPLQVPGRSRVISVGPAAVHAEVRVPPPLQASARYGGAKVVVDEAGGIERYLVDRDPWEERNLLTEDEAEALRSRVEATLEAWAGGRPGPGAVPVAPPRPVPDEVARALRQPELAVGVLSPFERRRFAVVERRARQALAAARAALDRAGIAPAGDPAALRALGYVE